MLETGEDTFRVRSASKRALFKQMLCSPYLKTQDIQAGFGVRHCAADTVEHRPIRSDTSKRFTKYKITEARTDACVRIGQCAEHLRFRRLSDLLNCRICRTARSANAKQEGARRRETGHSPACAKTQQATGIACGTRAEASV